MRANKELARVVEMLPLLQSLILVKPGVDKEIEGSSSFLEALVGAIYLDKGEEVAVQFLEKHVLPKLERIKRSDFQHKGERRVFLKVKSEA